MAKQGSSLEGLKGKKVVIKSKYLNTDALGTLMSRIGCTEDDLVTDGLQVLSVDNNSNELTVQKDSAAGGRTVCAKFFEQKPVVSTTTTTKPLAKTNKEEAVAA